MLLSHVGHVCGAWTKQFYVANTFCAELETAMFAFEVAENLDFEIIVFEGDAFFVILVVKGCEDFLDWRVADTINRGRNFMKSRYGFLNMLVGVVILLLTIWLVGLNLLSFLF